MNPGILNHIITGFITTIHSQHKRIHRIKWMNNEKENTQYIQYLAWNTVWFLSTEWISIFDGLFFLLRIYLNSLHSSIIILLANILTIFAYLFGNSLHTRTEFTYTYKRTHARISAAIQKWTSSWKMRKWRRCRRHINREYVVYIFLLPIPKSGTNLHIIYPYRSNFIIYFRSGIEVRSIISFPRLFPLYMHMRYVCCRCFFFFFFLFFFFFKGYPIL